MSRIWWHVTLTRLATFNWGGLCSRPQSLPSDKLSKIMFYLIVWHLYNFWESGCTCLYQTMWKRMIASEEELHLTKSLRFMASTLSKIFRCLLFWGTSSTLYIKFLTRISHKHYIQSMNNKSKQSSSITALVVVQAPPHSEWPHSQWLWGTAWETLPWDQCSVLQLEEPQQPQLHPGN